MGRIISGVSGGPASGISASGSSAQANAGAAVAQNNLLELFPDGSVYPAQVTEYAATANVGNILAPTLLSNANAITFVGGVIAAQGGDGSLYVLTGASGANGLILAKYTALGAFVSSVVLDSTANTCPQANVLVLSNGSIAVTWFQTAGNVAKYAVYDKYLQVVQAATSAVGSSTTYSSGVVSCAISSGGFAMFYGTSNTASNLTIYNNSGVQQATAALAGTGGSAPFAMTQISNGNLLLTYNTGAAHQCTIYSTAAVQQVAPFAGPTVFNGGSGAAVLASVPGFFIVGSVSSGTQYTYIVYSTVGAQQGAPVVVTPSNTNFWGLPVVSDGINFWAIYATGVTPFTINFTKITTTGIATTFSGGTVTGGGNWSMSVAYDGCGNIIAQACNYANNINYVVFNVNLAVVVKPMAAISSYTGRYTSTVAVGDGTVLFAGSSGSDGVAAYMQITKYINTAILGPATSSSGANTSVSFDSSGGYKQITRLKGGFSSTFNHKTGTNFYGNAGSIVANSVTLQGM
jgi:hypothetical protein